MLVGTGNHGVESRRPLDHARDPMATPMWIRRGSRPALGGGGGGGRQPAIVNDEHGDLRLRERQGDPNRVGRNSVLHGIRQRFLDDPVDGELGRSGQSELLAQALELNRQAGGAHPFGQDPELGQARLGSECTGLGDLVPVVIDARLLAVT